MVAFMLVFTVCVFNLAGLKCSFPCRLRAIKHIGVVLPHDTSLSSMLTGLAEEHTVLEGVFWLQERGVSLVAAKWYFPALNGLLIVLIQEQADSEGVKFEVSLNGGTATVQKSARPLSTHRHSIVVPRQG